MKSITNIQESFGVQTADAAHRERIGRALQDTLAPNTRRAYESALRTMRAWCDMQGFTDPLSPMAIAAYLTARAEAGASKSTITTATSAIAQLALEGGILSPTRDPGVVLVLKGIARQLRGRSITRAHPLTTQELTRILASIDRTTTAGRRDVAILTLLYAGAFRRSEVAALRRSDIWVGGEGLVVTVRQSKTDGEPALVGIARGTHHATDPVGALTRWLATRGNLDGETPLFCRVTRGQTLTAQKSGLTGGSIALILQQRAAAAGLDLPGLRGHSGRAGHATSAASAGISAERIARTTRHKSLSTLAIYVRPATVMGDTTSGDLGL